MIASKKPKKTAEPLTEKKLLVWLRSALRSASRRYPPLYEALAAAKEPYIGNSSDEKYNPRQKFCYRCADCQNTFPAKNVAVDHIIDCGTLQAWTDIQGFMQRLFCPASGLQVLCDDCHDCKTLMSKSNLTKPQAIARKKVISFVKNNSAQEILAYLQQLGYNGSCVSNQKKREELLFDVFYKEAT